MSNWSVGIQEEPRMWPPMWSESLTSMTAILGDWSGSAKSPASSGEVMREREEIVISVVAAAMVLVGVEPNRFDSEVRKRLWS